MRKMRRNTIKSLLFLSPALVLVSVFFLYPLLRVLIISFQEWQVMGGSDFIGFKNYLKVFQDDEFLQTLWNTFIYTIIVTPMIFVPAVLFAAILKDTNRKNTVSRTIIFMPVAISFVAASFIWSWIYNDTYGLLNFVLQKLGMISQPVNWLGETWSARLSVSFMIAWKTLGFTMIILLAGIQSISETIYEAARIDGASKVTIFYKITLPLLKPTIFLALILSLAGSFKAFDQFYIMTGGGPMKTTQTMVMYINKVAFEYYDVGYGATISVVFLGILLCLSFVQLKLGGFSND